MQWIMIFMTWLMEQTGITKEFMDNPARAEELLLEAKFSGRARTGTLFKRWRRGEKYCHPGMLVPGSNITCRTAARYMGATALEISPEAQDALSTLVQEAHEQAPPLRGSGHGGGRNPGIGTDTSMDRMTVTLAPPT